MRYLLLIIFVLLPLDSFALNCVDRFQMELTSTGGCSQSASSYVGVVPSGCNVTLKGSFCIGSVWNLCCDLSATSSFSEDGTESGVIHNVLSDGENERTVGNQLYGTWKGNTPYPVCPDGFTKNGTFDFGYVKTDGPVAADGTTDLNYSFVRQTMCKKNGDNSSGVPDNGTPFGGSGGSGSGIDLSGTFTTPYSGIRGLNPANNPAQFSADKTFGTGSYAGDSNNPFVAAYKTRGVTQVWQGFVTSVSSSSLFSFSQGLFTVPDGGTSVISFDAGRYGQQSFDLASYASVFPIIKGIIMLICSIIAVKIIILKGGH